MGGCLGSEKNVRHNPQQPSIPTAYPYNPNQQVAQNPIPIHLTHCKSDSLIFTSHLLTGKLWATAISSAKLPGYGSSTTPANLSEYDSSSNPAKLSGYDSSSTPATVLCHPAGLRTRLSSRLWTSIQVRLRERWKRSSFIVAHQRYDLNTIL